MPSARPPIRKPRLLQETASCRELTAEVKTATVLALADWIAAILLNRRADGGPQ
jgi:hypothetical protein